MMNKVNIEIEDMKKFEVKWKEKFQGEDVIISEAEIR